MTRTDLYERHLIIAIYLSAFEMAIRGVLRGIGLELIAIIVIQGWIYVLPFLFLLFYPLHYKNFSKLTYALLFIQIFYLSIVVLPLSVENGSIKYFFLGIKNYYLPFVYFGIIYCLLENKQRFAKRLLANIFRIGVVYGVFTIFEYISLAFWNNSLFLFLRNIVAYNPGFTSEQFIAGSPRPIGISGTMQVNGLFFAVLAVLSMQSRFILKTIDSRYIFYFFVFCVFISSAKTYTIAFSLYFIISLLFSLKSKRTLKLLLIAILCIVGLFVSNANVLQYYHQIFFKTEESHTFVRMIDKIREFEWFVKQSVFPNGFMPELNVESNIKIPEEYLDQEVFIYKLSYQIGILGAVLWIFTVFRPLFTIKIKRIFNNGFYGVFFVSAFGFIHYSVVHVFFLFIIAIFCNITIQQSLLRKPQIPILKV